MSDPLGSMVDWAVAARYEDLPARQSTQRRDTF